MFELAIYSWKRCKRLVLNKENKGKEQICLSRTEYKIHEDVILELKQEGPEAMLSIASGQNLVSDGELVFEYALGEENVFSVFTGYGQELVILVNKRESVIAPLQKYYSSMVGKLRTGVAADNDFVIDHPLVSGHHMEISCEEGVWYLNDSSSNGTYVNGERVEKRCRLSGGEIIDLFAARIVFGITFCAVIKQKEQSLETSPKLIPFSGEGNDWGHAVAENRFFHRSPRKLKAPQMSVVAIEHPPVRQVVEKKPLFMVIGPSFTMMIPMVLGSMLAVYSYKSSGSSTGIMMYTGIITACSSALIGVIWALINMRYTNKSILENEKRRTESYLGYIEKQRNRIYALKEELRQSMIQMYPDTKQCLQYSVQAKELWTRNREHEDFLTERIGLGAGDISNYIEIPKERFEVVEDELNQKPYQLKKEEAILPGIPKTIDLSKEGIVGIVGTKEATLNIARILITQIAANNCYTDVRLAFVYDENKTDEWKRYGMLPHVWSASYRVRYMASDPIEAEEVFLLLEEQLKEREVQAWEQKEKFEIPVILFVSDVSLLEGASIQRYISSDASRYHFTIVILADSYEKLPNQCSYVIEDTETFQGVHLLKTDTYDPVQFDEAKESETEEFVKELAVIRVNEEEEMGELPECLTFFEMYGIHTLEELKAAERWKTHRTEQSLKAVIGQKAGCKDCILDVHEKYHGPHGLIAGTTGSGKSETLQTYILSLAVNYSPDDVGFFIIDYKGGGMANLFEGLPHMIGAISNLSGNEIHRAMVSIKSENRRRQTVFNLAGVNNINSYTKLVRSGEAELPVPHLFIVVDEFAELKREHPEFMKELISVAQVGRSLGVHLILATQKPAGTVDENIWSNSKFKLCLRVQDKQDSKEMLHKEDAAFITKTGRGYLQVGNDELYELFQSGWSGAEYIKDSQVRQDSEAAILTMTGGILLKKPKQKKEKETAQVITQLDAVRDALVKIAKAEGYDRDYSLWIPPIKNPLFLDEIGEARKEQDKDFRLNVIVGMYDDPQNQKQQPVIVDFAAQGHLAVFGTISSGKSTFMQTLAGALIRKYTAKELNLYMIDFSNKALKCFENAPQTGGVVCEDEPDRLKKLFYMLNKKIAERKKQLEGISYSAYIRSKGKNMPAILVLLDNYNGFREKTDDCYEADMIKLAHDGMAYGIFLAITANNMGSNGLPNRLADSIPTTLALVMNDRYQYSEVLRTGRIDITPDEQLKGRGLVKVEDSILEFQTALVENETDEMERMLKIRATCERLKAAWNAPLAVPIPMIPKNPVWSEFEDLEEVRAMSDTTDLLPFAYDEKSAEIYGVDLRRTFCYLVSGKARTGKKNMLKILGSSAGMLHARRVIIEHTGNEFMQYAKSIGAEYLHTQQEQAQFFRDLLPTFAERNRVKNRMKEEGEEESTIYQQMKKYETIFVFIADLHEFMESVYQPEQDVIKIGPFVENVMEKGSLHNIYFIAAVDTKDISSMRGSRAYEAMTSYHTGIQLGGNAMEAAYFDFSHLTYTEQNKGYKAGIGMIPRDNDESGVEKVIIPQYRKRDV